MTSKEIDSLKLLLIAIYHFDNSSYWISLMKKSILSKDGKNILKVVENWNNEDIKDCSNDMLNQLQLISDKKSVKNFISFWT